jgi:hypothetical protein
MLVILGLCAGLGVLVFLVVWLPSRQSTPDAAVLDAATFQRRLATARQQLDAGAFRTAADEFGVLLRAWQNQTELAALADGPALRQWARESAALADLCGETLEEILDHAAGVAEAEWLADFPHRYQGKAFLFDLEIRAAGPRHFTHPYLLWARGEKAVLDLDDLELLANLPLDPPRVIFLARLAQVRREAQRGWVVRLQPGSGVLLTEPAAARLSCPALAGPEVETILGRQLTWARTAAGQK